MAAAEMRLNGESHRDLGAKQHPHDRINAALCLNGERKKTLPSICVISIFLISHALESYTAIPYHMRSPCPSNPIMRPAYQGSNPISDLWSVHALRIVAKYLKR